MEVEIWKPIEGYEGLYEISSYGQVRSLKYKRTDRIEILKNQLTKAGYYRVELCKKGNRFLIHRLVAIHFIPNPENKPQVNHKDGNPKNNHISNLEWCTHSENMIHSYKFLDRLPNKTGTGKFGKLHAQSKPIHQIEKGTDNIINTFESINLASKHTGIFNGRITAAAKGIYHTAGGFKWQYA